MSKKTKQTGSGAPAEGTTIIVTDVKKFTKHLSNAVNGVKEKTIAVTSAVIKDGLCNYTYEVLSGVGAGDAHTVKGKGIVDVDMEEAFQQFNVHLAIIDDVFSHSGVEIENIEEFHNHELTASFTVTGFKMKGELDNESVILVGFKQVNVGGAMDLESPRIILDGSGGYRWHKQLKATIDKAKTEVELYREGKSTAVTAETTDPNQLTITGEIDEFEKAKEQE